MSYILDALKKSEQERGHGNIPGVQTVHSSSLNYNHKKTYWPYFLIAAVLLNLAALLYFVFDKQDEVLVSETTSEAVKEIPVSNEPVQQETKPDIPVEPKITAIQQPQKKPVVIANKTQETPVQPKQTDTVIEFYDLPDSIKMQLPAIIISAHVYSSNPTQRSIVVNNNFLEEGEYVLDDLILYEITSDGAIFLFNGTMFHHGVVSSWQ